MTKNKQKLQQDQHKQQHHPERPKKVDKIKRKNNNNNVINISRNNFTNRNVYFALIDVIFLFHFDVKISSNFHRNPSCSDDVGDFLR